MCIMKTPKPAPVDIPTPAPAPAVVDEGAQAAQSAAVTARKKRLASQEASTVVTGGQGLTQPANTTSKSLFGQ